MTWSGWVKRGTLGSALRNHVFYVGNSGATSTIIFAEFYNDTFRVLLDGSLTYGFTTTQLFRDPSAWYHIVFAYDSTQATSSDRMKLYVNGTQVTSFSSAGYPPLNYTINNVASTLQQFANVGAIIFDGYLAEQIFVDGQGLPASSFGEFDAITGVWKPKKYAGTYGTNGFHLNFSDNSAATAAAIGKDYSGNGNNFTPNNISVTAGATYDSMIDTPTPYADGGNGRGNYATWNAAGKSPNLSLTAGNLNTTYASSSNESVGATIGVTSGKWYWEATATNVVGSFPILGIAKAAEAGLRSISGYYPGYSANSWGLYCNTGAFVNNASTLGTYSTVSTNDVLMFALDMDSGKYWMGKNGTWFNSGVPASGTGSILSSGLTGETIFPMVAEYLASASVANFGQRPFAYTPPTGFKALNTQNLPDATIKKGSTAFDVVARAGTGSTFTQTGLKFAPDLVWIKSRSSATNHEIFDKVRGATLALYSNNTNAEAVDANGYLSAFTSDGYTLSAGGSSINNVNGSTRTFVDWAWKEGAAQGFDIVTYTGNGANPQTVSHALGVAPKMMIVKVRNLSGQNGYVYHASNGTTPQNNCLFLDSTSASLAVPTAWNNQGPTSSAFYVGNNNAVNGNTYTYVAYLFADVAGFSKFGSYTGNGSTDGPFVFLGFKARWLLIKRTDAATSWFVYDTARNTYNAIGNELKTEVSDAEATNSADMDITASGFKLRVSGTARNASGGTYIYAAFAENPFKNSLAR
jgi:hypothetical protein